MDGYFCLPKGKPAYEMDKSHPDWAPTLQLGHSEGTATVSDRHGCRQHRHCLRKSEGGDQSEQNNMNEDESDGVQEHAEAAEEEGMCGSSRDRSCGRGELL